MEGKKQVGSSSSSSISELFGSKDSYSSEETKGIFGSIFAPSSKVMGRGSFRYEAAEQKKQDANEGWNKSGAPDKSSESGNTKVPNMDTSYKYQEQRVQQPCHLSSSIYYGGQDIYSHPQTPQSYGSPSGYKNDGGEDDSDIASRGNWWQGSLYY